MTNAKILRRPQILRACIVLGIALAVLPAHAAKPTIGIAALVVERVEGTWEERTRKLALQDEVYRNEMVETGAASASELRFVDDTRITVGPRSKVILDEFVYDPDPGEGKLVLQAAEGVFRFFSGTMDSSSYIIKGPAVTAGIRGTIFVGAVDPSDGAFVLILESRNSTITVTTRSGATVTLDAPGQAAIATPDGHASLGAVPDWMAAMVEQMDGVIVKAAGAGAPPATSSQRAAANSSDPGATEAMHGDPASDPGDGEGADPAPLRGLPRALANQDPESVPGGLETAVEGAGTRGVNDGEPGNDQGGSPGDHNGAENGGPGMDGSGPDNDRNGRGGGPGEGRGRD